MDRWRQRGKGRSEGHLVIEERYYLKNRRSEEKSQGVMGAFRSQFMDLAASLHQRITAFKDVHIQISVIQKNQINDVVFISDKFIK